MIDLHQVWKELKGNLRVDQNGQLVQIVQDGKVKSEMLFDKVYKKITKNFFSLDILDYL